MPHPERQENPLPPRTGTPQRRQEEAPADDFIAYVQQSRLVAWFRWGAKQEGDKVFPAFYAYDPARTYDAEAERPWPTGLKRGSILWVVTRVDVALGKGPPMELPPMLVARIQVANVRKGNRYQKGPDKEDFPESYWAVIEADPQHSSFLPVNDVSEALSRTRFGPERGKPKSFGDYLSKKDLAAGPEARARAWRQKCGRRLQSLRRLQPSGQKARASAPLEALYKETMKRQVFLSYRFKDFMNPNGTPLEKGKPSKPMKVARLLLDAGFFPWFADFLVPGWKATGTPGEYDAVGKILRDGLQRCQGVIGIASPGYAEPGSWSRVEWNMGRGWRAMWLDPGEGAVLKGWSRHTIQSKGNGVTRPSLGERRPRD